MAVLVMTILISPLPPVHISWKLKRTYKTALATLRNQIKFSTANINRYNKITKRKAMGQSCFDLFSATLPLKIMIRYKGKHFW